MFHLFKLNLRGKFMGGKFSRDKGQRGEREAIGLLQPIIHDVCAALGRDIPKLQRNLLQSDCGGCDLHGLEWLALEVKRQETLNVAAWWDQTVRQATNGRVPVLLYRRNGERTWHAVMWAWMPCVAGGDGGGQWVRATVEIESFLTWFRSRLYLELTK
jgi:hypothetical protein